MATENNLGDILSSLLENPEVMKAVSAVASGAGEGGKKETPAEKDSLGEGFTLPPQLLSKLPQMMSAISGLGELGERQKKGEIKASLPTKSDKQRKALLFALKPFLCEKRCALIDGLIQLEGLAGLLGTFTDK